MLAIQIIGKIMENDKLSIRTIYQMKTIKCMLLSYVVYKLSIRFVAVRIRKQF